MTQFLMCWMLVGSFSVIDLIDSEANAQHPLWTEYRLQFSLADYSDRHHIEPLNWRGLRVVGQRFEPVKSSKGVVHIVHGYLDHAGIQEPLIRLLTQNGFTVRTIDLPGHGVSQGARAQITSMEHYDDVLNLWLKDQSKPLRIIGHSMGGKSAMLLSCLHPSYVNKLAVLDIAPVKYTHSQLDKVLALLNVDLSSFTKRSDIDRMLSKDIPDKRERSFLMLNLDRKDEALKRKINLNALKQCMPEIMDFPQKILKFIMIYFTYI